jgi:hypothetical protein
MDTIETIQIKSLQNAIEHYGLSKQFKLHIDYLADKNKKADNKKKYFVGCNEHTYSPKMTYNECNHYIMGLAFYKANSNK